MTNPHAASAQAAIRAARMLEYFLTTTHAEMSKSYAQWDDFDPEAHLKMTHETFNCLAPIMFPSRDDYVQAVEWLAISLSSAAESRILLATIYQKKNDSLLLSLGKRWNKQTFEGRCLHLVQIFAVTNLPDGYTFEKLVRTGIANALELHAEYGGTEALAIATL